MRNISKHELIAVYKDLPEFLQSEGCFETNCKCMNDPDLLFEETTLSKKMDPYVISIKAINCSTNKLGKHCLIKKTKNFLNKKIEKNEKRK